MIWTPPEELERQRNVRVKGLQDKLMQTIRDHPIPPAEVLAALGGTAVYIIGLNIDKYGAALDMIGKLKREMKTSLTKHWPHFMSLRKEVERQRGTQVRTDTEPDNAGDQEAQPPAVEKPGGNVPG